MANSSFSWMQAYFAPCDPQGPQRVLLFWLFRRPWKRALRKASRFRLRALLTSTSFLLCMVPASAFAQQQTAGRGLRSGSLPDAPLTNLGDSAQQTLARGRVSQRRRYGAGRQRKPPFPAHR